jgi:hypothetical protein
LYEYKILAETETDWRDEWYQSRCSENSAGISDLAICTMYVLLSEEYTWHAVDSITNRGSISVVVMAERWCRIDSLLVDIDNEANMFGLYRGNSGKKEKSVREYYIGVWKLI